MYSMSYLGRIYGMNMLDIDISNAVTEMYVAITPVGVLSVYLNPHPEDSIRSINKITQTKAIGI